MPGRESEPGREAEAESQYFTATRYRADAQALAAYNEAQKLIFANDCDLSAFRIRFKDVPHVVVLGALPTPEVDKSLGEVLRDGEPAALPRDIVSTLRQ